jgi:hypothetical protein
MTLPPHATDLSIDFVKKEPLDKKEQAPQNPNSNPKKEKNTP